MEHLIPQAEAVETSQDFVRFLNEFRSSAKRSPEQWASGNQSLEDVFEALCAWIEDMSQHQGALEKALATENPWKFAARLLAMGAVYE